MSNTNKVQPKEKLDSIRLSDPAGSKPRIIPNNINLSWSLKPIVSWMNLLGVPPQTNTGSTVLFKNIIRITVFTLIVIIQFWLLIDTFFNSITLSKSLVHGVSTSALSWNFIIHNFNQAVYTCVGHTVLLLITRSNSWLDVIESFKQLDKHLTPLEIYPQCRRISIYIIIYNVISVASSSALLTFEILELTDSSLLRKCLDISGFATKIIPATTLILFCTLAHLISLHLGAIRQRIKRKLSSPSVSNLSYQESHRNLQLKLWQRQHLLVCKTINKLNQHFGFFLAIEVGFVFVGVINSFMFLLLSVMINDKLLATYNGIVIFDHIVNLFLLTYFSTIITDQINLIYEALSELVFQEPSLQNEIALFSEQLAHMRSEIDALGFFKVDKQLFPSLIGTTLTYFLILLQFHIAENP